MSEKKQQYVCPMHPEETSDQPGRCSKCDMALVEKGEVKNRKQDTIDDKGLGPITWRSYMPLIVVVGLILLVALAISWGDIQNGQFSVVRFVVHFMAGFFIVFAGFKLMDLKGFAEGYFTYDLLARRWFGYGYVYPFIELLFGLSMVAGYHPDWLLWSEFGIMIFSGLGVTQKIAKGEKFQCACLGTFLKVPLTYVTLIEDYGMAALALLLILIT